MTRRCLIYARISQDREGAGLGVGRQEQDCRELAERLGWTIVAVHRDNDLSASSGRRRPGYQQLLDDLRAGLADAVVCWHTDRLHRRPTELEEYIAVCETHGVVTQTVKAGSLDLTSPSGQLVARMLGNVARHEVDHARERIRRAREQKRSAGAWGGGRRPFGYEPDGHTVRPDEAAVVLDATRRILAGQALRSLAADLNARGVRTSTGRDWTAQSLRAVLLRARNAGLIEHGHPPQVVGPATWPAIVPEDDWRAVHDLLTDPRRTTTITRQRRLLGSGLFLCGVCGSTVLVTATSRRGRDITPSVYRCRATRGHVSIAAEHVDRRVNDVMVRLLARPDAVARLSPVDSTDETAVLRAELTTVRTRLQQLADSYADGLGFDPAQLLRANTRLNARRDELERRLAAHAGRNATSRLLATDDLAATWPTLTADEKQIILRVLVTVTILPAERKGRLPGGTYFDPARVQVTPNGPAPGASET